MSCDPCDYCAVADCDHCVAHSEFTGEGLTAEESKPLWESVAALGEALQRLVDGYEDNWDVGARGPLWVFARKALTEHR